MTDTRARNIAFAFFSLLLIAFVVLPPEIITWKTENDSNTLMEMVSGESNTTEGSYYVTAQIFAMLGILTTPFLCLVGVSVIWLTIRDLRRPAMLALAGLMLYPGVFLGGIRPQKDVLVLAMSAFLVHVVTRYRQPLVQQAAVFVAYLSYGAAIRTYFLLIWGAFVGLLGLRRLHAALAVIAVLLGCVLVFALPDSILYDLQYPRDMANARRVFINPESAKTAFFNWDQAYSAVSFFTNYVYALLRLQLPILFQPNIKTLFLQFIVVAVWALVILGYRKGDRTTRMLLTLFASHQLVITLFEPDLGSYLRHSLSVVTYLAGALVVAEQHYFGKEKGSHVG